MFCIKAFTIIPDDKHPVVLDKDSCEESSPNVALVNLIGSYLEIRNGKQEAYEPHREFAEMDPEDNKVKDLEIVTEKEETVI
ncbi:13479_t:CDS:2 [Gigaspora margarita]|uniref:13479_t:CDS:1 n=1 Tax=Gigaspora margarita TaxID=4874 RepID=A0ABN7VW22_GIGMA|nr:13479_t:CDS:2 [Gigaspora margarita]